jgi:hypothetical protein
MIPEFERQTGNLPPGEHDATWEEFVDRFGWNPRRRQLLDGIAESLDLLKVAGCLKVWVNGSFVTTKEEPGDFDAVWDPGDVDFDVLDPIFGPLGMAKSRVLQKDRFGGEWFPNLVEGNSKTQFARFFQNDRNNLAKGIVVLRLENWSAT